MVAVNTSALEIISLSDSAAQGDAASDQARITRDGRYVVFASAAANLDGPDGNGRFDIFVRDTFSGSVTHVSANALGTIGNDSSFTPSISDNGRFVVFESYADNLIPGGAVNLTDIYVRDLRTGAVRKVSAAADGAPGAGSSNDPMISDDGRFVVFTSGATNLGTDNPAGVDVFRKDLLTGAVACVSLTSAGFGSNGDSFDARLSDDGRFIVFGSTASDLVAVDTNGVADIFLRDMALGTTVLVSTAAPGSVGMLASTETSMSGDGRFVVFERFAEPIEPGGDSGPANIYLRDMALGTTELISSGLAGAAASARSLDTDVSDDGRYVVFVSSADNLVADDTNARNDVFLRDRLTATTTRLSVGLGGTQANDDSFQVSISADGRFVVFGSYATNLVDGDFNGVRDVFRVSLFATEDADFLIGSAAGDVISGLGGADIIRGGGGADTLDGGRGGDTLEGGAGNDVYRVDTPADEVVEIGGEGSDNVVSTVSYSLRAGQEVETLQLSGSTGSTALNLTGNAFANTLRGNAGANILNGGGGADALFGLGGNDIYVVDDALDRVFEATGGGSDTVVTSVSYTLASTAEVEKLTLSSTVGAASLDLTGNGFANALQGGAGANVLDGKDGFDTLRGLTGDDVFAFTTALGSGNRDVIADFGAATGNNDSIRLENAVFTALTTLGPLASAAFAANAAGAATTAAHRIVYDTTDGRLLYDADGMGGAAAVQFATLTGAPTLTSGDFVVV